MMNDNDTEDFKDDCLLEDQHEDSGDDEQESTGSNSQAITENIDDCEGFKFHLRPEKEKDLSFLKRSDFLTSVSFSGKRQIGRQRKIAGNLPDWEPWPPAEIATKKRKRSKRS